MPDLSPEESRIHSRKELDALKSVHFRFVRLIFLHPEEYHIEDRAQVALTFNYLLGLLIDSIAKRIVEGRRLVAAESHSVFDIHRCLFTVGRYLHSYVIKQLHGDLGHNVITLAQCLRGYLSANIS